MPGFVSVLKLWICKWDFYEDLCVILCFSWKLMPLLFPGDVMHIYQKPNTLTSSPFLKTGMRKLSRWWKKNVFKKQVGVKKGGWKRGRNTQLQLVPGLCSRKAYNQLLLAWSSTFQQAPSWHTAEQGFPYHSCSRPADLLLARHESSQMLSPVCFYKSPSELLLLQKLSHQCNR